MKKSQNLFSNDRFHRVPHCRFPVFPPTGSWEAQHGVWRFSRWSWRADWQMLDSDAGRDWGQEEKGTTEDEMAGWHHGLGGHESDWTPRVGDGQGGLACCNSWSHKELDTTERLNWTEAQQIFFAINIPLTNRSLITILPIASSFCLRAHPGNILCKDPWTNVNGYFIDYFLGTTAEGFVLSHASLKNNKHLNILSSQFNRRKERTNHKT